MKNISFPRKREQFGNFRAWFECLSSLYSILWVISHHFHFCFEMTSRWSHSVHILESISTRKNRIFHAQAASTSLILYTKPSLERLSWLWCIHRHSYSLPLTYLTILSTMRASRVSLEQLLRLHTCLYGWWRAVGHFEVYTAFLINY